MGGKGEEEKGTGYGKDTKGWGKHERQIIVLGKNGCKKIWTQWEGCTDCEMRYKKKKKDTWNRIKQNTEEENMMQKPKEKNVHKI